MVKWFLAARVLAQDPTSRYSFSYDLLDRPLANDAPSHLNSFPFTRLYDLNGNLTQFITFNRYRMRLKPSRSRATPQNTRMNIPGPCPCRKPAISPNVQSAAMRRTTPPQILRDSFIP